MVFFEKKKLPFLKKKTKTEKTPYFFIKYACMCWRAVIINTYNKQIEFFLPSALSAHIVFLNKVYCQFV